MWIRLENKGESAGTSPALICQVSIPHMICVYATRMHSSPRPATQVPLPVLLGVVATLTRAMRTHPGTGSLLLRSYQPIPREITRKAVQ